MLCHSRRTLSRGHPRGLVARLYRLWSREAIRRIFRYCFHLVNSSPNADESWRYSRFFLSLRPSPRFADYSASGNPVSSRAISSMILLAAQAAVGAVVVALAPGRHPAGLFALRMMRHHERTVGHFAHDRRA